MSFRILIVDDEDSGRCALAELLEEEGYTVDTAEDGLAALAKLAEFGPDAVVTDFMMPRLDGLGLMQKALALDAERPIIMMTGLGAEDTAVALGAGAIACVTKPIQFDELLETLARAIHGRRSPESRSGDCHIAAPA